MPEEDLVVGAAAEIADKGAVDLDRVDRQRLQMPQRGMPGAEIVERDTATGLAQRADKTGGFFDVVERRGFGDLDDDAARDLGAVAQLRGQGAQPRPVGGGQARDVEAEPDIGMQGKLGQCLVQHVTVDQTDKAELLQDRDEIAGGDDLTVPAAHPQQAFVVIDVTRFGRDDRLECKQDALLAQGLLHLLADREAAPLEFALFLGHPVMRIAVASGTLGFGERRLRACDHIIGCQALVGEGNTADRHRGINGTATRHDRCRVDNGQDLFGHGLDVIRRAQ